MSSYKRSGWLLSIVLLILSLLTAQQSLAADITFQLKQLATDAKTIGQKYGDEFGTADVSAIELPDGRIRIYFGYMDGTVPGQIGSAISSDGLNFTAESGLRLARLVENNVSKGGASPFIYQLSDGRYRLYYTGELGVMSAISSDGLTFTREGGARLTATSFVPTLVRPGAQPVCTAIVPLIDGRYRMYCSQQVQQSSSHPIADRAIFSAVSSDLLTWIPESGRRIGPGTSLSGDADHPTVIEVNGSAITIAYDQLLPGQDSRVMVAKSDDGLIFTTEYFSGIYGNESFFLKTKSGKEFLYYGKHDTKNGSIINVAISGPVDFSNQVFRKKITCYVNSGIPVQNPVLDIYDYNPVCPKDYSTTPPAPATPAATPTPAATVTPTPSPVVTATATPTALATPTAVASKTPVAKKITIACLKGKTIKKVTAVNPKCPKGFKKK